MSEVTPKPATISKAPSGNGAAAKPADLEIKDSALIFNDVWTDLEAEYGRENLRFPKEIILLGGAPGAGKGTNTEFILNARGLTCPPVVVSALLDTPEAQRIKNAGMMVGDREAALEAQRRAIGLETDPELLAKFEAELRRFETETPKTEVTSSMLEIPGTSFAPRP